MHPRRHHQSCHRASQGSSLCSACADIIMHMNRNRSQVKIHIHRQQESGFEPPSRAANVKLIPMHTVLGSTIMFPCRSSPMAAKQPCAGQYWTCSNAQFLPLTAVGTSYVEASRTLRLRTSFICRVDSHAVAQPHQDSAS